VPIDQIYIPKMEEVKYTIGSQWKQRFLIEKDGDYYISSIQFNIDTGRWVNYHDHDWQKRPWLKKCGGCHATGVDLDKKTFVEPGVGCEACHGLGSHHAALPARETFEKRATIINPSKLTGGVAVQICGSCHNRGKSTRVKGSGWPVGYLPGKALEVYYRSIPMDHKKMYSAGFSKSHHQQYIDWKNSKHADSGIGCIDCHTVHELGNPLFRSKTKVQGDALCLSCHADYTKDLHQIRAGITCVQCHRDKPIAGVYQYYSAMNPIRRHAYICAKCHEGASPSFASYVVHEPDVLSAAALDEFPLLYYAAWFMVILAGGIFAIFIPYTVLWGVRELLGKFFGRAGHD